MLILSYVAVAAAILACWRMLSLLFDLWERRATEHRPLGSELAGLMAMLQRQLARVRTFALAPVPATIALLAAWASFLLAPGTASASVLSGSAPHGSLLGLLGAALAFGIAVATPPIAPTAGVETTEYKIHKWVMIVGGAITAGLAICSQLQMFAPTGSKLSGYLTLAASIGAAALLVLKAAGYEDSRTDQKTEAIKAQAAVETAKATAAAGANAGTATAALATDLK